MTSKREVPCMWTGMNEDDFRFFLNGFRFVAGPAFISNFYRFRVFSSWQRWVFPSIRVRNGFLIQIPFSNPRWQQFPTSAAGRLLC